MTLLIQSLEHLNVPNKSSIDALPCPTRFKKLNKTGTCIKYGCACSHAIKQRKCNCETCATYVSWMTKRYYEKHKAEIAIKNKTIFKGKRLAHLRNWRSKNPERLLEIARSSYYKVRKDAGKTCPISMCPICLEVKKLYWDHSHTTGKFRGWICQRCNTGIGMLADAPDRIKRALEYLNGDINGRTN